MSITHTVLFHFKADVPEDKVKATCADFLALKQNCIHPTKANYITSLKGGRDNSIEGRQGGITHGFVAEFQSKEDRDYYVNEDPAHQAFVKSLDGLLDNAVIIDFTDGVF